MSIEWYEGLEKRRTKNILRYSVLCHLYVDVLKRCMRDQQSVTRHGVTCLLLNTIYLVICLSYLLNYAVT